jgi:DNA-binding CsgD family transcriptional regulator
LLTGAEPPPSLRSASESLGTVLLSFPPMLWLLFELLGPVTPRTTDRSTADGIVDAFAATRSFAERDVHHAEPLLIRLSAFPREDQHFWLTMLAACAAARDALPVAARVFGAVDAFQHTAGTTWLPTVLRDRRTAALATCAGELGEERLQVLLAEGAAMSLAEAAVYASRARSKRGRPSFGWDSLTPTELDVVRRVAEGLGNAQIAATLFMSTATVKTHLTHVYAKLGIATRAELAAAAARRPLAG